MQFGTDGRGDGTSLRVGACKVKHDGTNGKQRDEVTDGLEKHGLQGNGTNIQKT